MENNFQEKFKNTPYLNGLVDPTKLLKIEKVTFRPPQQLEKIFNFTYSELEILLKTFGTSVALKTKSISDNVTYHTNIIVIPEVNLFLKEL